jgi:hypothetical protein
MTDCGRHTLCGWIEEHAGSWAWFEASSGYDEDEGGNEGRLRTYRPTGDGSSRVRFDRRHVGLWS